MSKDCAFALIYTFIVVMLFVGMYCAFVWAGRREQRHRQRGVLTMRARKDYQKNHVRNKLLETL